MSNFTLNFDLETPFDYSNLGEIEQAAKACVANARRNMKLLDREFQKHHEDMMQTALLALFKHRHSCRGRALAEAKYDLIEYVRVIIWGLNDSDVQPGYGWHVHLAEDLVDDTESQNEAIDILVRKIGRHTENDVIALENENEEIDFWRKAKQEFMYVLTGMCGKTYGEDLVRGAEILVLSSRGYTLHDIAETLYLSAIEVKNILGKRRKLICDFLNLSPMQQAMVMTRGQLLYCDHTELTQEILNSSQRFFTTFPHGTFSVFSVYSKTHNYNKISVSLNRQVNGKTKTFYASLGKVGRVTYERLYEATHRLQKRTLQASGV